ncbi:MAG: hypothetical protein ABIH21_01480 [Patescibacteria group bacterium]
MTSIELASGFPSEQPVGSQYKEKTRVERAPKKIGVDLTSVPDMPQEPEFEVVPIPIEELSITAYQSIKLPEDKQEWIWKAIEQLGAKISHSDRKKIAKTLVEVLHSINNNTLDNQIVMSRPGKSESFTHIPDEYRPAIDVAYMNARINAGLTDWVSKKVDTIVEKDKTFTTPQSGEVNADKLLINE